jgi:hypothetical protein
MCLYFNKPKLLRVNTSTDLSSYVLIFLQAKAPMYQYSYRANLLVSIFLQRFPLFQQTKAAVLRYNRPKLICVNIPTDQSSYVLIFLHTKAPMCQYSYRPKLLCVDIPTDQSSYVSIFLQRLQVISTNQSSYVTILQLIFGFVGISKHRSFEV